MKTISIVDEVLRGVETPEILYVENIFTGRIEFWTGKNEVTKIEAYAENGQMAGVPWLAIYVGDNLFARMDVCGMKIVYRGMK